MEHIINEYLENHAKISMMNGLGEDKNAEECSIFLAKKSLGYLKPILGMFKTTIIPFDSEDIPTNIDSRSIVLTNARLKDHLESNESALAYDLARRVQNDILGKAVILGSANRVDTYQYEIGNIDNLLVDDIKVTFSHFIDKIITSNHMFKLNPGKPWIIIPKHKSFEVSKHESFVPSSSKDYDSPLTTDFLYLIGHLNDVEIYVNPNKFDGVLFGSNNSEMFGGIVLQLYNMAEETHTVTDQKESVLHASTRYRLMYDSDNSKKSYMYYNI